MCVCACVEVCGGVCAGGVCAGVCVRVCVCVGDPITHTDPLTFSVTLDSSVDDQQRVVEVQEGTILARPLTHKRTQVALHPSK